MLEALVEQAWRACSLPQANAPTELCQSSEDHASYALALPEKVPKMIKASVEEALRAFSLPQAKAPTEDQAPGFTLGKKIF